jgi:OOP family OmpA-OmpF porin
MTRPPIGSSAAWLVAALFSVAPAAAAPDDRPASAAAPGGQTDDQHRTRTASLPAKGLFVGDELSETAKTKLSELILQALGMSVEVALIVPTGPWEIDGGNQSDNALTSARLNAVRRFLVERGVSPRHLYVESRVDQKAKEPRLDVQFYGRPAED